MGTTTLAPQQVTAGGLAAVYATAGAAPGLATTETYIFNNTGNEILHFKKSGAGACNVIFTTPGTIDGLAVADRTVVVPATSGDVFIKLSPAYYNTIGTSMLAGFTVSEVTGLTLAIIRG